MAGQKCLTQTPTEQVTGFSDHRKGINFRQKKQMNPVLLPSSFRDDHFCSKLMEAIPKVHIFKVDFCIIWTVIVLVIGLKESHKPWGCLRGNNFLSDKTFKILHV